MVQLTIHVRPKDGYTYPNRIKTITVDSSYRLEQVIDDLKLDTKKGISIFSSQGRTELALNTSLASNNVQSGDILETCSSPMLSCVLSALMKDLEAVRENLDEDERTQEHVQPFLDLNPPRQTLDPWPDRWTHDSIKSRITCLAYHKKVIQRQDRFATARVPQCTSLVDLFDFMHSQVFDASQTGGRRYNSMANIIKPISKDGGPTTCWQLLQYKLDKIRNIANSSTANNNNNNNNNNSSVNCSIEAFLKAEKERHQRLKRDLLPDETMAADRRRRKASPAASIDAVSSPPQPTRKRRRLMIDSPSTRIFADQEWKCTTCTTATAGCMCLTASCPFQQQPTCLACFSANHPILQRNHERIDLADPRAKAVLKSMHRQERQDLYCPEYASGPFSILCALYSQMKNREFSLSEARLKELAQPICRSNLYDHQAQGRNAFACIEGLMERNFVRMERLPGRDRESEKYSLLPAGEAVAKYCYAFEQQVNVIVKNNPTIKREINRALHRGNSRGNLTTNTTTNNNSDDINPIKLIVDNREDANYANRLMRRCQQEKIQCERRELPAGDYLFLLDDNVCPIVLERKSWSDLADSVLGQGQGRRRLDCVKLGGNGIQCHNQRCQLCKMKASGCPKIMFVIEGARCASRDGATNKCSTAKRCQFCRELQQRHGRTVTQEALEEVLYRLQVDHGCFIHFTRSYNETIESLFVITDILHAEMQSICTSAQQEIANTEDDDIAQAIALSLGYNGNNIKATPTVLNSKPTVVLPALTYDEFCSKARPKRAGHGNAAIQNENRDLGQVVEWNDSQLIKSIFEGTVQALCGGLFDQQPSTATTGTARGRDCTLPNSSEHIIDLNESFNGAAGPDKRDDTGSIDSVVLIDISENTNINTRKGPTPLKSNVITLDSDDEDELNLSQNSVQIIECPVASSSNSIVAWVQGDNAQQREVQPIRDDVEIITENIPRGTNRSNNPQGLVLPTKTPLLILSGLYQYDMEFFKDLSEVWKAVYHKLRAGDIKENEIQTLCRTQLQRLQVPESPLVDRSALLFWTLYFQLRYSLHIHVVRESKCKQILTSRWKERAQNYPGVAAAVNHAIEEPWIDSAIERIPPSQVADMNCIICRNIIEGSLEVTPCMHKFHSPCLHKWLYSQPRGKRQCPVCRYPLGTYKDSNETPEPEQMRKCTPAGRNCPLSRVRAARLLRFENSNSSNGRIATAGQESSSLHATLVENNFVENTKWECTACTLQNDMEANSCTACGCPQTWSCKSCTLQNTAESALCVACRSPRVAHHGNTSFLDNSQALTHQPHTSSTSINENRVSPLLEVETRSGHSSRGRNTKCGACQRYGHNRANATAENCPNYYDEGEVKRRAKKKEQNERRAQEARAQIAQHQQAGANMVAQLEEAKRVMAHLEESASATQSMRQNEVKRLEKARARAERQAGRYA